jgi:hypothetical protein
MRVYIPVSAAELIDRITILKIKKARIPSAESVANVSAELEHLVAIRNCFPKLGLRSVCAKETRLGKQNMMLWDAENELRALEFKRNFSKEFIAVARRVYRGNDERARLKREIDSLVGSALREEKWFSKK